MSKCPEPIVIDEAYDAPMFAVWNAITNKDQMRQWFFEEMADFRPEVGFTTEFSVSFDGQNYLHQWRVTDVVPGRRIRYDWRYGGVPGGGSVTWELSPVPGGTKLHFTCEGIETFPQDNPAFTRESCQGGWEYFLYERLKAHLTRRNG